MDATAAAGLGVVLVILALIFRWKWRSADKVQVKTKQLLFGRCRRQKNEEEPPQFVHKLCPHSNVLQAVPVEQKDSLDDHLDLLTRKLAEKEGRLRISKSKLRETQNEIENLHAIDLDVRVQYREIMDSLRSDLMNNEKECKKLQEQIEWVSRRRAELKEEVRRGHKLYGEAAVELASNVTDLQRGRVEPRVTAKPHGQSFSSLRHRKEPQLPKSDTMGSLVIKTSPPPQTSIVRSEEITPSRRHK